jgi:hypothetical protein
MSDSHRYVMLLSSLPYHGPLFSAKVTPLSRLRLRERFSLLEPEDRQEIEAIADLLDWYSHPVQKADDEIVRLAKQVVPELRYPFSRELLTWRLEMRTVIGALRRRQQGKDIMAVDREWGYGRWLAHIRKYWQEPYFRLERVYPWLPDAAKFMDRGETIALERLLLEVVWNYLQKMENGHVFDFEGVLIYLLRWDQVSRWIVANGEAAEARYIALLEEGLEQIHQTLQPVLAGQSTG